LVCGRATSKGAFFNLMIRDRYEFEEHHSRSGVIEQP
jgi:hypothetical protein